MEEFGYPNQKRHMYVQEVRREDGYSRAVCNSGTYCTGKQGKLHKKFPVRENGNLDMFLKNREFCLLKLSSG